MFYHLLYPLHEYWSVFNVFKYITFRSSYATVTALLICFIFGGWVISKLEKIVRPFPRMSYDEAVQRLNDGGHEFEWGGDLGALE